MSTVDGARMDDKKSTEGIGIKNVAGRLIILGGSPEVISNPGDGFAIEIEIPLVPDLD